MAETSRPSRPTDLQMPNKWKKDAETSPERTKVWSEPPNSKLKSSDRKLPVVYYLSRNGQLEHPHFIEVPLSSPPALFLKDVMNRLNFLRGKGMASSYSWSCKRSYKNGYVWHDLSESDFIYPAHGQEYILKGSEILDGGAFLKSKSDETVKPAEGRVRVHSEEFQAVKAPRRRNQSWSSFDLHEYKVYAGESFTRAAADASTQTDDKRRRRRAIKEVSEEIEEKRKEEPQRIIGSDEITEISPPPSDSSPETLENLMKSDGRIILRSEADNEDRTTPINNNHPTGRGKATSVLLQLISCGSIGFKACGPGQGKENGFSLISHYKPRLPRGGGSNSNLMGKDAGTESVGSLASGFGGRVKLEDKEYFSASLIETKKDEFPALKRSSSYNADRSSQLELEEVQGRKQKATTLSTKKQSSNDLSCSSASTSTGSTLTSCSSQHGSKRIMVQP
ncbi:hypothetical protein ACH5RR_020841 [Cinchona calisaya]|uniref:SOSEKI DIX-like domain-containing protein n=1 Tax=Cinchona calisaya TaxID=153742 RepID=A0ABD2ZJE8_9GENT